MTVVEECYVIRQLIKKKKRNLFYCYSTAVVGYSDM